MSTKQKKEDSERLLHCLEESVLSYKSRQNLSSSSFCGPNRTYPAQDAAHARNCLVRASQNKAKLGAMYGRIVACCRRRLKKYGGTPANEETSGNKLVDWYLKLKKGEQ